jgi:hypothetical protein
MRALRWAWRRERFIAPWPGNGRQRELKRVEALDEDAETGPIHVPCRTHVGPCRRQGSREQGAAAGSRGYGRAVFVNDIR